MPNTLGGWGWWVFTAIILKFLLDWASGYAKPRIDSIWGKYSERQKLRNEEYRRQIDEDATAILSFPNERDYFYFEALRNNLQLIGRQISSLLSILATLILWLYVIKGTQLASEVNTVKSLYELIIKYSSDSIVLITTMFFFGLSIWQTFYLTKTRGKVDRDYDTRQTIRKRLDESLGKSKDAPKRP